MSLDDVYFKAMLARDHRFDGKFYVGVKTTGVYCRPVCPARPKRENVEFFPSALRAERAGYRPCLRCRPEAAPASPAWIGKSAIVQRALREIGGQGHLDASGDSFAARFGVSARHLRRLFLDEIGQTPKQISDNNRLNFARQLIVETALPLTSVAMSSGFGSLRRFNDAFAKRFRRPPSALRRSSRGPGSGDSGHQREDIGRVRLALSHRPPYDFATILSYYRRHRIEGVEHVGEDFYQRVFEHGDKIGVMRVTADLTKAKLHVEVAGVGPDALFVVCQRVRQMFDLDSDPLLVANAFEEDGYFKRAWRARPGLRIPRSWDMFEGMITTILGQLVSVPQAGRLTAQLVRAYGRRVTHPESGEEAFLFPRPEDLRDAALSEVKTTEARKASIRAISRAICDGGISLSLHQDPFQFRRDLSAIKGIGPWSVEYIALRALGDADAFPEKDLFIQRAVKGGRFNMENIRPWRGYAAIYIWNEGSPV